MDLRIGQWFLTFSRKPKPAWTHPISFQ